MGQTCHDASSQTAQSLSNDLGALKDGLTVLHTGTLEIRTSKQAHLSHEHLPLAAVFLERAGAFPETSRVFFPEVCSVSCSVTPHPYPDACFSQWTWYTLHFPPCLSSIMKQTERRKHGDSANGSNAVEGETATITHPHKHHYLKLTPTPVLFPVF